MINYAGYLIASSWNPYSASVLWGKLRKNSPDMSDSLAFLPDKMSDKCEKIISQPENGWQEHTEVSTVGTSDRYIHVV